LESLLAPLPQRLPVALHKNYNRLSMAHHKRKRPKHQRAGCLLCKPQKDERETKEWRLRPSERRRIQPDERNEAAR